MWSSLFKSFNNLKMIRPLSYGISIPCETNPNQIATKKRLRHCGDYGILNIKKDICANRCPTGATDRRLARLFSHKIAVTFGRVGGYFCVLLLSLLPMAYPRPKQVRHKPSTEINPSIVNIRFSPPFRSIPLWVSM